MTGYYKTKESVEEYIKLARDVNGRELIARLKPYLPLHAKVLEIGSGPGTDWQILSEDYNVVGSDNSEEFLRHLRETNPKGRFITLDASSLKTKESFDGLYSNKVLHHLKDSELMASIKAQGSILKPAGIICHSFWRGEGSEIFNGLFVNYHTATGLRQLFDEQFEILLLEEYAEFDDSDSLLLIGRKLS
jgi:SAM-dependent methyltransferase